MAVGSHEFSIGRPIGWSYSQLLRPGPLWLSTDIHVLYGLAVHHDLHYCLCAQFVRAGLWRIYVRHLVGRIPGEHLGLKHARISAHVSKTLTTVYACEIVPTVLRTYVTAYVCLSWGAGILLSAGVLRAVVGLEGDLGWRLPFCLQWCWPIPLLIGAYFAPESPWNAVRRNKLEYARECLMRLRGDSPNKKEEVESALAYIRHTTELEKAETEGANFLECFKGTNLRRTEIVSVFKRTRIPKI